MTDLFTEPTQDDPILDDNKDYFEELVGDGKKFKTPQDLARGKFQSDLFIKSLQTELSELRSELKSRTTLDEVVSQLKQKTSDPVVGDNQTSNDRNESNLTPEKIQEMLEAKLAERETERFKATNRIEVQQALVTKYGSDEVARTAIAAKARELEVGTNFLGTMAETNPKAFLALMGVSDNKPLNVPNVVPSSVNTASLSGKFQPTGPRTMTWWNEQRKKNPNYYFSKDASIQRHRDATTLGERFFNQE